MRVGTGQIGSGSAVIPLPPNQLATRTFSFPPDVPVTYQRLIAQFDISATMPGLTRFQSTAHAHEGLSEPLQSTLRRFAQHIGDTIYTLAAPYHAGSLFQQCVGILPNDVPLWRHPITLCVAKGLEQHYARCEDLIGQHLYATLHTVCWLCESDQLDKAEDVILECLALDPFNRWFLHIGRDVSERLGHFARQSPAFYERLHRQRTKAPKAWRKSATWRMICDQTLAAFASHSSEHVWKLWTSVYTINNLVGPLIQVTHGIALSAFGGIKWLHDIVKLGMNFVGTLQKIDATERKSLREISQYQGDYRSAVLCAEEASALRMTWATLVRNHANAQLEYALNTPAPPALPPHHLLRPRLMDRFLSGVSVRSILHITDVPGSGKTTCAAEIISALQQERTIFWYDCRHGSLAELERALRQCAYTMECAHPTALSGLLARLLKAQNWDDGLAYLSSAFRQQRTCIVCDNVDRLLDDAAATALFEKFVAMVAKGGTSVILLLTATTQRAEVARWALALDFSLAMTPQEVDALCNQVTGRKMADAEIALAHQLTGGHAQTVRYLAEALTDRPAEELLGAMCDPSCDPRAVIAEQLFHALPSDEQRLLAALSIFRQPLPIAVIEAFAAPYVPNVKLAMTHLLRRMLVRQRTDDTILLAPIAASIAHDYVADTTALHRHAAEILCRTVNPDQIDALSATAAVECAYHLLAVEDYENAARYLIPVLQALEGFGPEEWSVFDRSTRDQERTLLAAFTPEIPLSPALQFALFRIKGYLAYRTGSEDAALRFFRHALAAATEIPPSALFDLFFASVMADEQGDSIFAAQLLERLVHHPFLHDHPHLRVAVDTMSGILHQRAGRWRSAAEAFVQAILVQQAEGEAIAEEYAWQQHRYGLLVMRLGETTLALRAFTTAAEVYSAHGTGLGNRVFTRNGTFLFETPELRWANATAGTSTRWLPLSGYVRSADPPGAGRWMTAAEDHHYHLAQYHHHRGQLTTHRGEFSAADAAYGTAYALSPVMEPYAEAMLLYDWGVRHAMAGEVGWAKSAWEASLQSYLRYNDALEPYDLQLLIHSTITDAARVPVSSDLYFPLAELEPAMRFGHDLWRHDMAHTLANLALLLAALGYWKMAASFADDALKHFQMICYRYGAVRARHVLALAHHIGGDLETAAHNYRDALDEYTTLDMPLERAQTALHLGMIADTQDDPWQAIQHGVRAGATFGRMHVRWGAALATYQNGLYLLHAGRHTEARRHFDMAMQDFAALALTRRVRDCEEAIPQRLR